MHRPVASVDVKLKKQKTSEKDTCIYCKKKNNLILWCCNGTSKLTDKSDLLHCDPWFAWSLLWFPEISILTKLWGDFRVNFRFAIYNPWKAHGAIENALHQNASMIKPESYLFSVAVSHRCTLLTSTLNSDRRGNVRILRPTAQKKKHGMVIGVWRIDRWESGKLECCVWLPTTSQHSSAGCHLRLMQPRGYHHLIKAPKGISFSWFHIHWHNIQEDCSNFIHASQLIGKQGFIDVHMPLFQVTICSL